MTEKIYEKITRSLRSHPYRVKTLNIVNKALTLTVYIMYPYLLSVLAFHQDVRFWKVFLVPGVSFILVSIFRNLLNAPRPYEVMDIVPLIKKDTKGKSFPSRHVFSVFVISMSFYYISVSMGLVLMIAGVVLAVVRVIGGVHFPKDVIIGAVIGILSGVIGFNLIP